jgi:hypothetical protein
MLMARSTLLAEWSGNSIISSVIAILVVAVARKAWSEGPELKLSTIDHASLRTEVGLPEAGDSAIAHSASTRWSTCLGAMLDETSSAMELSPDFA